MAQNSLGVEFDLFFYIIYYYTKFFYFSASSSGSGLPALPSSSGLGSQIGTGLGSHDERNFLASFPTSSLLKSQNPIPDPGSNSLRPPNSASFPPRTQVDSNLDMILNFLNQPEKPSLSYQAQINSLLHNQVRHTVYHILYIYICNI